jgi:hypothetical protein
MDIMDPPQPIDRPQMLHHALREAQWLVGSWGHSFELDGYRFFVGAPAFCAYDANCDGVHGVTFSLEGRMCYRHGQFYLQPDEPYLLRNLPQESFLEIQPPNDVSDDI